MGQILINWHSNFKVKNTHSKLKGFIKFAINSQEGWCLYINDLGEKQ